MPLFGQKTDTPLDYSETDERLPIKKQPFQINHNLFSDAGQRLVEGGDVVDGAELRLATELSTPRATVEEEESMGRGAVFA